MGADVHRLGVVPTPALAFLTGEGPFQAGIMVSASHNPADDNGLKVIGGDGMKLDDAQEEAIDDLIWRADEFVGPSNAGLGRDVDATGHLDRYLEHRLGLAGRVHSGLRVVVDCANGAGGVVAPTLLAATGASVEVIFDAPDGANINLGCGATAPEALARRVAEAGADIGFALDGDADRCVAVDERGQVVDGDQLHRHARARAPSARRPGRRHARRQRPLQRRPGRRRRGRRWPGRAHAGRRPLHPRRHARGRRRPGRREERPRHHRRARQHR